MSDGVAHNKLTQSKPATLALGRTISSNQVEADVKQSHDARDGTGIGVAGVGDRHPPAFSLFKPPCKTVLDLSNPPANVNADEAWILGFYDAWLSFEVKF
ncbi:hypothetical protein RSOLAG22IIIB_06102 [Rhizoctonia solani]|uniref:Uncharacterized protein n=1 Tax=Rhizoctonia solani TaxID=456999 RepID=A0A0K6GCL4_9AGAM|nr:hypothetical protein RSOLAG22IIIB_06102 [Rhizoctonia solani]